MPPTPFSNWLQSPVAASGMLLGSVTRHVVSEAECDVLVSTARKP